MTVLTINLLGPFSVVLEGQPVDSFSTFKVRALLAYLAIEGNRPLDRSHVAGFLWPDVTEDSARGNLRFSLSNLRKVVKDKEANPPFLLTGRRSIQLNPDAVKAEQIHVDIIAFQSLHRQALTELQITAGQTNIATALEAISLYRGPFLDKFGDIDSPEFDDWVQLQRELLHRQMADLLTKISQLVFADGAYGQAVVYAQKLVDHEPWSEDAHVQLMNALWHNGQGDMALRQYEKCCQILEAELDVEPAPETIALYEAIRDNRTDFQQAVEIQVPTSRSVELGTTTAATNSIHPKEQHNIPPLLKPFFGREDELAHMTELLLRPSCRQLTLIGPGGMGKTQLAIEYARRQLENKESLSSDVDAEGEAEWPDGVWFVSLVNTRESNQIPVTIADALNVDLAPDEQPLESICRILRRRKLLLILDNFEHLLDGALQVNQILEQAPNIQILSTSRTRLNLKMETVLNLSGLTVEGADSSHQSGTTLESASAFFVDCALRKDPAFSTDGEKLVHIRGICQLVGGMPLAIELAAAWTRVLSLDEIAESLAKSLSFLSTSMPDLPERHRNVQALIKQSWQRMSQPTQQIFAQLSVFRRSWDWRAMQQITNATLDALTELIDNSLVSKDQTGRYQVHGLLRQFGQEQLEETPELNAETVKKHTAYYMAFLENLAPDFNGPKQAKAVQTVDVEIENVRAAWYAAAITQTWSDLEKGAVGLYRYLDTLDKIHDGAELFGIALESLEKAKFSENDHARLTIRLLNSHAYFLTILCEFDKAKRLIERSLDLCANLSANINEHLAQNNAKESHPDELFQEGRAHHLLGSLLRSTAPEQARAEYQSALERWQGPNSIHNRIFCLQDLSDMERQDQNFDAAIEYAEQALRLARQLNSSRHISMSLAILANVYQDMGAFDQVRRRNQEAVKLAREIGNRKLATEILNNMAITEHYTGDIQASYAMFQEALSIHRSLGGGTRSELMAAGNVARTAIKLEKYQEAESLFRETAQEWQRAGDPLRQARNLQGLVSTLMHSDQVGQARAELNQLLTNHYSVLNREVLGMVLSTSAEVLAAEGDLAISILVDAYLYAHFARTSTAVKESEQRREALTERGESALLAEVDSRVQSLSEDEIIGLILEPSDANLGTMGS
ncbi:MAG: BTAD domain-containing putative transcriptional regulator [Chloroflexota bacterium]